MEAGQGPGEEDQGKEQCFKEDGCSGHQAPSFRGSFCSVSTEAAGQDFKGPWWFKREECSNYCMEDQRGPPCFGSVGDLAVGGGIPVTTDSKFPATMVRRASDLYSTGPKESR